VLPVLPERGDERGAEGVAGRTVRAQQHHLLNFVPLVLFNQFKLFFNFFQLAINLSQLVPILKVGTPLPTKASSSPTYRR
jgi:phospholipid-translocating ATPase